MEEKTGGLKGRFIDSTFVDEEYHEKHAQYLHSHNNRLELFYILEGDGLYYVDKHEYVVSAGSLVICNAGITHGEGPLRNNKMVSYSCAVDSVKADGLPENCLIREDENPVLYFGGGEVGHIMQAMYSIFFHMKDEGADICNMLSDALLSLVCKRLSERENVTEWSKRKSGEFINEIMDYLDKNYAEPLTLEGVAERFFMSRSAFAKFFKQETGMTLLKYLLYRRIGEAQSYLMNTDISVGEVGSLVGYYDISHFSATFRTHTGLTPSQYRNNFIKK